MGPTLVWIFLAAFALMIATAIGRRLLNPFSVADYASLPVALREEIQRVLPGFVPRDVKRSKHGDEVRMNGLWEDRELQVSAHFDADGRLVEFEAEASGHVRTLERSSREAMPAPAAAELDRVLGEPAPAFERSVVTRGALGDEPHFEFKGYGEGWKWEVVVSASGRLHELEREQRAS